MRIMRVRSVQRCVSCPGEAGSEVARNTLKLSDWFVLIVSILRFRAMPPPLAQNVENKPALLGGMAVAAFIKKPLKHGFRYSVVGLRSDCL